MFSAARPRRDITLELIPALTERISIPDVDFHSALVLADRLRLVLRY